MSKTFKISYKTAFALLGFSAIVTEIVVLLERGLFNPINFFSYFTIQTNIIVFITLMLSALFLAKGEGRKLDYLRSAVTVYILIVGIGFAALLSGVEGLVLTAAPWDNVVLHYVMPVVMLVDFIVDRPVLRRSFRRNLLWLLFPALYVVYGLLRGGVTGWYPYPFLNIELTGASHVAAAVAGLLLLGVALVAAVTYLSKRK